MAPTTHAVARPRGLIVAGRGCLSKVYPESVRRSLAEIGDFSGEPVAREDLHSNLHRLRDIEVLCTSWGAPTLDEAMLAAAPQLRVVLHGAGSVRPVVTDAFWRRNLVISSAFLANSIPVAEYTVGAILLGNKRVFHHVRAIAARRSLTDGQPLDPLRFECAGNFRSTVGLVAMGTIGRLVRDRLRAFDVRVITYDPFLPAAEASRLGVELVSLPALFEQADVVSVHAPLVSATEGMIRGAHFAALKPHATFINTSRGAIVNEAEMVAALRTRPDLQAVLDVTWPEPPVPGSPLYELPNVFLTPHIAGSTGRECERLGEYVVEELRRYAHGKPLRWSIARAQAEAAT
ncbi:MAG TPA: hydroxyacid dehydrogenase [Opitutaceae bacterium]|nr:hydroxyacid dehydrogenase [Opitutaceae bacterium]